MKAHHLKRGRQEAAQDERAHEPEDRRIRGMRAAVQEKRPQPGADEAAADEARERERADNEPLGIAPNRHQQRESHDDPVDGGQGRETRGLS